MKSSTYEPGLTVTVVRDWKIQTALRTNQIVGFVTLAAWKKKNKRIYFIRKARRKFTKFEQYSKNKPDAEEYNFERVKIFEYMQYSYMFLTKPYKILSFFKREKLAKL